MFRSLGAESAFELESKGHSCPTDPLQARLSKKSSRGGYIGDYYTGY